MGFMLLDYSHAYYARTSEGHPPPRRGGKFVQMRHGNAEEEYLVLAPRRMCVYHANIVERFMLERGLQGAYNHKRDKYDITQTGWDVVGGGTWELDEPARLLRLAGVSMAYGAYDRRGLLENLKSIEALRNYDIEI